MKKFYDAVVLKDAEDSKRRFRNILANSGKIMESGETRDLKNLYVMGRDGKLIAISDLNTNPDKQTEDYSVKAQADHGELVDGELVDTIEKQFGSCKVWLEDDGLHARMYFANDDDLADHAWAISEDASYSTGIDWFPNGYHGAGEDIDDQIGILREISMVLTGNDPRAKTIDHNDADATRALGSKEADAEGGTINEKGAEMAKTNDDLTPNESEAIKQKLTQEVVAKVSEIIDDFTTDAPENETEPTAKPEAVAVEPKEADAVKTEAEPEKAEPEAKPEETKETEKEASKDNIVHNININFRDRVIKNEGVVSSKDTKMADKKARNEAIRDALKSSNFKFDDSFNRRYAEAVKSKDDISGLGTPLNLTNIFTEAMEKSDGILSYVYHIGGTNGRGLRNNALSGTADYGLEAAGHRKGDKKQEEALTNSIRVAYDKMIYKKLSLDAMEIYENPELLDFRARELYEQIIVSIERAIFIGDGRTAPSEGEADLRMFDETTNTGLYPIAKDCEATEGYGSLVATTYKAKEGDNLYDGIVGAREFIRSEGDQILVVKPSVLTAAFQAKVGNRYLIEPGATAEDIFRVAKVFSPLWMESATEDAFLLVRNGYTTTGEMNPSVYPFFDVNTNQNVLLNEMPLGGTLTKYKSAAAISGLTKAA